MKHIPVGRFLAESLVTPIYFARAIWHFRRSNLKEVVRKNSSMIILGNGPSLASDMAHIKRIRHQADLLVVNTFASTDYFTDLRPDLYLVTDPAFDSPREGSAAKKSMIDLSTDCTWPLYFLLPQGQSVPNGVIENTMIKTISYNKTRILGLPSITHRLYKSGFGMPSCRNVIMPSLVNAINMRYQNIYVFGLDFSWLKLLQIDYANELYLNDKHFSAADTRRINLSKRALQPPGGYSVRQQVTNFLRMLNSLDQIRYYAESQKTKIYNCSANTMVQSFERLDPSLITTI